MTIARGLAFVALSMASAIGFARAAHGESERAAIAALIVRGVAAAPANFAVLRGERTGANTYIAKVRLGTAFRTCIINKRAGRGAADWLLVCRSIAHPLPVSVDALAAYLKPVVNSALPRSFSHFSRDDDSVGDLTLGWDAPSAPAVVVYAFVTENERGSYYDLTIEHISKE